MSAINREENEYTKKVVIRFSHIGDVILLTGVLYWRYKEYNEKFILITAKGMETLFEHNPAIEHIETFPKEELKSKKLRINAKKMAEKYPFPLYDMHATLRTKIFKSVWKSHTYTYPKDAIARRIFLLTAHKFRSPCLDLHVVQRYAYNFLEKSNYNQVTIEDLMPKLFLTEEEKSWAKNFLLQRNNENKPLIALHPFATHKGKLWKKQRWLELYSQLKEQDYFPLFIGLGEEFERIKAEHKALNILSLRQSAAVLAQAKYLVTGDSAPLHLASSVQCNVIALFGATSKEWGFFPLGKKDQLLKYSISCNPCSLHGRKEKCKHNYACINNVQAHEIVEIIKEL